jgi:hypothetical protein
MVWKFVNTDFLYFAQVFVLSAIPIMWTFLQAISSKLYDADTLLGLPFRYDSF